uniref:Fibronectin type-III domain-containing protein n=1 Tax=Knipowitschia caucasica TaxID=637954 RepID=A0AAV2IZK5_KNICA
MDLSRTTAFLLFMVACVSCVTGEKLPTPENLQVNILDGEVIVLWNKPTGASSDVLYNVQFGHYAGEWKPVKKCTNISKTFCDLSNLIEDYLGSYKVRVQLEESGVHSEWTPKKKILPNLSELQPPSFTMWATSSTLTINIHKKPVLRKIFLFGITYTIYLVEKQQNKSTISYLKDDIWDHPKNKVFHSLHWGKEYCVTIKVEGNTGMASSVSPQQCVLLPEQEWIIIAVTSLTVVGIMIITAFISAFIFCYVKRPVKTPAALKSPANFWRPLSIREVTVEVVTDKGWFMSSARTEWNSVFLNLPTTFMMDQQNTEEERRPSTDSGVSMKSPSDGRREDSGCGSVGGQDAMCNYPTQHDRSDGKSLDSGLGLKCHSDTSSLIIDDQDSECLNKSGKKGFQNH